MGKMFELKQNSKNCGFFPQQKLKTDSLFLHQLKLYVSWFKLLYCTLLVKQAKNLHSATAARLKRDNLLAIHFFAHMTLYSNSSAS